MHAFILTRGNKKQVDDFIMLMQGKFFPFRYPMNGKFENSVVQMNVQPIQLWSLVFPEEQKDIVFRTLFGQRKGKPNNSMNDKRAWALRKALNLDEIGEYSDEGGVMPLGAKDMEIIGVGTKKDYFQDINGKRYDKRPKDIETFEGL